MELQGGDWGWIGVGHIQQDPCMGHALIDVETGKASEYCMGQVVDSLHSRGGNAFEIER